MKPLILVCIPSGRTWEAQTAVCVVNLMCEATAADVNVGLYWEQGSQITSQRNSCVDAAIKADAKFILWLDSDMEFPPTALQDLLKHGKDIVGGTYCKKNPPYTLLGRIQEGEGRLKPATWMPGGCMLVRTAVYKRLEWPWYFETPVPVERGFISEDYNFCTKAIAAGFKVWCDIDLSQRLVHLGTSEVKFALPEGHSDKAI